MMKIMQRGLTKQMLTWMFSFIANRKNIVRLGNVFSNEYVPLSGVPAGCSLSSFLFNIFIDDIVQCAPSGVLLELFADDVKVLCEMKCRDSYTNMQEVINSIRLWSLENDLPMNVAKIKALSISKLRTSVQNTYNYGDIPIQRVTRQKDLGIIFDSKFNFDIHIESMSAQAFVALGFVKRFANGFSVHCKKTLFYSLVRAKTEYASVIWAPYQAKYIEMVERVQRKFSIWVLNLQRDPISFRYLSYDLRLEQLKIDTLFRRRVIAATMVMFDLISNRLDAPRLSEQIVINEANRNLRNSSFFRLSTFRATYLRMQPLQRMMYFFNNISDIYLTSTSRMDFKNKLRRLDNNVINMY